MILDTPELTARLFFPRRDATPPPDGAADRFVGDWHVRLHAGDGPTLLLFHGNGEVVADYDNAVPDFAAAGLRLAVADFPGYGLSRGAPTLRRIITEAASVVAAIAPDFVMGRSLGSACANAVDAPRLILESGFVDLRALIRRRGMVPPEVIADADLAVFDPIPKLRRARGNLLVLHGAEDQLISPDEARQAFAAAGAAQKELVLVEGRGHNDISRSPQYWDALARFAQLREK